MTKKLSQLNFRFSYAELFQQALEKSTFLRRDGADLAGRGISENRLDAFDDLLTAFTDTTDDVVFAGQITEATGNKDKRRQEMLLLMRDILSIAQITFTNNPGVLKAFGDTALTKQSDAELMLTADNVIGETAKNISALQTNGVTDVMANRLTELRNEIKQDFRYISAAKGDRELNTTKRHEAANALYSEMVSLCNVASKYYQDRDAARYNDYIIYGSSATAQTRSGKVNAGAVISREFTGLNPDVILKIRNEGPAVLDFYFSATNEGNPSGNFIGIQPLTEQSVTAASLGFNPSAGALVFCIRNTGDLVSGYRIKID